MNLEKLKFRNAKPSDISNIMKIEYASFSHLICESEETFEERIKSFSDGFRIMEYQNEIIGYLCSEIWDYQDAVSSEIFTLGHSIRDQHNRKGSEIYISSMGLLPTYRGHGLGKQMFDNFISYSKETFPKIKTAILLVSEKWTKARKIYQTHNFKEIEIINDFFVYEGEETLYENGVVMRKELT